MIYIITFIANSTLGLLVFLSNPKKKQNRYFGLLVLSIVLWIVSLFAYYNLTVPSLVLLVGRFNFVAAIYVAFFALMFTYQYPLIDSKILGKYQVYIILVLTILLTLITQFTGLIDSKEIINTDHTRSTEFGKLYFLFAVYYVGIVAISIYVLIRKAKLLRGLPAIQLRYLIWGYILGGLFGASMNIIAPALGVYSLQSFGPLATVFFVGTTSYSIIRHRLLDIKVLISRSLIYGFLLTIIALSFIFITIISGQFFGGTEISRDIIALLVAVLIVFGLDPLKKQLSLATDKIFFKAKIDYQAVLQRLTEILSVELDLNRVIQQLETILQQELKIKSAVVVIRQPSDDGSFKYKPQNPDLKDNPQYWLRNDGPLVTYISQHKHPSLLESLERKIEDAPEGPMRELMDHSRRTFERLEAALASPVFAAGQMNAVLVLGPKLSGDSFSNEDLQLIDVLSPQIASAIEKAKLYQEVKDFSRGLENKVELATEELQERNTSLVTLQHITNEITQTLDFKQVTQKIVDAIAHELGYIGGMLFLLDNTSGRTKMMPQAITQTPLVSRAMALMPKAFGEMFSYLDEDPGLDGKAVIDREIKFGSSLDQFISPTVPAVIARAMTKLAGVKGLVAVPIQVEGEVIGVMDIATSKPTSELRPRELETIKSLADEIGIVARNVRLFEKIQATNAQLERANDELKQLDQAKSEFVSIASHQLRTPMTGIMGYLSMMTSGDFGKIAPEHQKILVDLLAESQRMIRLINQFLNVSKIEAGKFTYARKPIQIENLIKTEIKEITKAAKDKGLKIVANIPTTPLPIVTADGDKLQDVILNLLDNAIKYTNKGSITVTVEAVDDHLHVAIQDTGIGISPSDARELFNKFVRGTGIAQIHPDGSGLGLFIAKSVIDAHGGKIWAESAGEGKGSTFQFTIPIHPPDLPEPVSAAAHITGAGV